MIPKTILSGLLSLALAITTVPTVAAPLAPTMLEVDKSGVTQVAHRGGAGGSRGGIRAGGIRGGHVGVRGSSARSRGSDAGARRAHTSVRRAHAGVRRGHARWVPRRYRGRPYVDCDWRGGRCYRGGRYWGPYYDGYDWWDDGVDVATSYPPYVDEPGAYCPAPGTQAWHEFCASKYASYKPWTGTFTTYSGQERYCVCP